MFDLDDQWIKGHKTYLARLSHIYQDPASAEVAVEFRDNKLIKLPVNLFYIRRMRTIRTFEGHRE